ncbi:carbohydrate ABC transporter permease [Metamycoplasma equirhinis]|uniref:carbohydrate ABC transporter permease n=1 Tax=Metamycoplasma equirhinis TaxID=92402 RepID=UPI003594695F
MLLTGLKIRNWQEKHYLNSKQELMSKPYSSTSLVPKILSMIFKVAVLGLFSLLIIFPFYFMISQSLTSIQWQSNKPDVTILFPRRFDENDKIFHFENIRKALEEGYMQSLLFTSSVTLVSILVRLFFSMTLGYALSIKNWKGKKTFFTIFLALMILPEIALLSGQYKVIVTLGWQTKSWLVLSLIIPFAASIFFSFMYKNAFEAIPNSVKESAMLDGASSFRYFINIALPMVKSTTWTVAILTAFASWNSYTWPSLLISDTNSLWRPMNLWVFSTGKDASAERDFVFVSIRMAATILAILPMFIAYFALRRRIMAAISRQGNATKG